MPVRINYQPPQAQAIEPEVLPVGTPRRGVRINYPPPADAGTAQPEDGDGIGLGKALLLGGGAVAAGLAARSPVRTLKGLNALRQQLMLSGMALPKSVLGNVGAMVEASLEGRTLEPLRQFFKTQTLRDVGQAYKTGASVGPTPGAAAGSLPSPGRIMGALDTASQGALRRAGATAEEAQSALLQAPLEGRLGTALESPIARYVHPFRRTPFNQFLEGWDKLRNASQNKLPLGVYAGTGAVHGAATADEDYPMSVPLAIAASARYGLPYGLAALTARGLAGARTGGGIAGSVLPVSEYGIEQAVRDPLKPFTQPAALTAMQRLLGE